MSSSVGTLDSKTTWRDLKVRLDDKARPVLASFHTPSKYHPQSKTWHKQPLRLSHSPETPP